MFGAVGLADQVRMVPSQKRAPLGDQFKLRVGAKFFLGRLTCVIRQLVLWAYHVVRSSFKPRAIVRSPAVAQKFIGSVHESNKVYVSA